MELYNKQKMVKKGNKNRQSKTKKLLVDLFID